MDQYPKSEKEKGAVRIQAGKIILEGNVSIPNGASGIVLFAHGSGSSRFSPRNRYVAEELNKRGIATLLFDLLTQEEEVIDEQTAELRFDIGLLTRRLVDTTDWAKKDPQIGKLNLGYFGASTGAAAALVAAAERPSVVKAVVSRGGRPDLAGSYLAQVKCPTLLLVGGYDGPVIDMNNDALSQLKSEKKMIIVPGATHLFEERGKLEEVAVHAGDWFLKHLGGPKQK
jgi:dienelactone hydrolase